MSHSAYATLPVSSLSSFESVSWIQKKLLGHARTAVFYALKRGIMAGVLEMTDPSGIVHRFGTPVKGDKPDARRGVLHIHNDRFWVRVYLSYDVGFSEAYMAGECDSPNLKEVLNLFVDNERNMIGLFSTFFHKTYNAFTKFSHFFSHSHAKSIADIAGYDASNELYTAFLSKEMQYSCPIWSENEGGVCGDLQGHRAIGDLEAAQVTKIDYIIRKARLRSGGRLLEIGSGWGSVAIAAAKLGCTVDTLTLSIEQKQLAEKRIEEAGFSGQIRVHLMDYRDMPPHFERAFDACVSLEMLEDIGLEYMHKYFAKIDWALKDSDSVAVLTATCYPESTHTGFQGPNFIRKFHWPNTILPSAFSLAKYFCTAPKGRFCIDSIEDFGTHYPRCLREWGRRLDENWNSDLIDSLQQRYPELKDAYMLEMFRRKWHYMFLYMEVVYSRVWLTCVCWTLARPPVSALDAMSVATSLAHIFETRTELHATFRRAQSKETASYTQT
ncbi:S-adenosyl-L-methionine-dependent methyltransferase [Mycena maculata]|uniref:S-adenosyl-L-methionine-dependent methyltransferase n=1 Tax=Mycena maculata TaxID=230809 RepID=A0AAD7IR70_9AGAR|nr:S-adenosyl-L-methionine-dependent methyltransferase [Mycena maculata]